MCGDDRGLEFFGLRSTDRVISDFTVCSFFFVRSSTKAPKPRRRTKALVDNESWMADTKHHAAIIEQFLKIADSDIVLEHIGTGPYPEMRGKVQALLSNHKRDEFDRDTLVFSSYVWIGRQKRALIEDLVSNEAMVCYLMQSPLIQGRIQTACEQLTAKKRRSNEAQSEVAQEALKFLVAALADGFGAWSCGRTCMLLGIRETDGATFTGDVLMPARIINDVRHPEHVKAMDFSFGVRSKCWLSSNKRFCISDARCRTEYSRWKSQSSL